MSNNTEFKWDDASVLEFVQFTLKNSPLLQGRYTDMEQFKESKQPKPEWKILSLKHGNTLYTWTDRNKTFCYEGPGHDVSLDWALESGFEIHSVKRLSDNEVFAIGDKVTYRTSSNRFDIIKKIKLGDNQFGPDSPLAPYFSTENSTFGCYIHEINHYKEPIFTTEDGISIYTDYLGKISVVYNDFSANYDWDAKDIIAQLDNHINAKYFSTKEAANEYIIDNKPLLSLKEIREVGHAEKHNHYYKKLVALAESKLK